MGRDYKVYGPARMPVKLSSGTVDEYLAYVFRFEQPPDRYVVLAKGALSGAKGLLTRITSLCTFGHVFGSYRCDCHEQLSIAMDTLSQEDKGLLILGYDQECRGMGIEKHVEMYDLIDKGMDTVEASYALGFSKPDLRNYRNAARVVQHFGVVGVRLLTNNREVVKALRDAEMEVERVPIHARDVSNTTRMQLNARQQKLGYNKQE